MKKQSFQRRLSDLIKHPFETIEVNFELKQMSRYQIAMNLIGNLIDRAYHISNAYFSTCLSN